MNFCKKLKIVHKTDYSVLNYLIKKISEQKLIQEFSELGGEFLAGKKGAPVMAVSQR